MKILHVTPTYFSRSSVIGGGERYIDNIVAAIQVASKSIIADILSFAPDVPFAIARAPRSTLFVYRGDPRQIGSFAGEDLDQLLKEYDVVHVHQCLTTFGLYVAARAKALGCKTIGTDHGGGEHHMSETLPSLPNVYDAFHAQSDFAALAFRNFERPIQVIYGPVDETSCALSVAKRDMRLAISIGRILPHKGFEHAIEALPSDMKLTIIGRPYDVAYIEWLSKLELVKRGQVVFESDLDDKDLMRLIASAGVLLHTSVHQDYQNYFHAKPELLSLAPLESMCSGTPAIVSRAGALSELARLPGCRTYRTGKNLAELLRLHLAGELFAASPFDIRAKAVLHYGLHQFGEAYMALVKTIGPR